VAQAVAGQAGAATAVSRIPSRPRAGLRRPANLRL